MLHKIIISAIVSVLLMQCAGKASNAKSKLVSSPIFVDPNYHGSCDPEVIWNENMQKYYVYYTSRRSLLENNFLATPIGVISSDDLTDWKFEGYCSFDGHGGKKDSESTFWAPAIIAHNDTLHMFVTWKPDTITTMGPWGGPGMIVHYKTPEKDPLSGWQKVSVIHDTTMNTLDATVYKSNGTFHVWYKGKKKDAKKNELYHIVTSDFMTWEDRGFSKSDVFNASVTGSDFEEAPYVFKWKGMDWLITDPHNGLFVYNSKDSEHWNFQGTIMLEGGTRNLDNSMARHCSAIVRKGRAFLFYHVEPWRNYSAEKMKGKERIPIYKQPTHNRQSVLQMSELEWKDGKIVCDRNKVLQISSN